ncbi:MAG: S8 family serine peptidase [Sphingobacteriaceae bacterium]|nr:S8 family serine peptidase [Sphingobacteriaceae bacterium]
MKKLLAIFSLLLISGLSSAQMSSIEPVLRERLTNSANAETFYRVRILLADRVNVDSLGRVFDLQKTPFNERVRLTTSLLTTKAEATQPAWISKIEQLERELPNHLKFITPYWITNLLVIEAKPALILALVNSTHGIEALEEDMDQYHVIDPVVESPNSPNAPNGTEIGLRVVRAPALWARDYTGRGRLGMNSDNGVTLQHPSFSSRWRGNFVPASHAWYGPGTTPNACDNNNHHGTHVMGTMVGLQLNTFDTIGLAFNAQWIAAGSLCAGSGGTTGAFQWALNPDGNLNTWTDVPDVINNSWGGSQGVSQCNSTVVPVLNALEAAGVAVVFSAGNSGPGISTITSPKNVNTNEVNVFCTGNIEGAVPGFPIANSSSRGPSICINPNPELNIKPEVVAPGTNVRSASGTSGYASLTGTSMAAPHVAGAVLLLKEAFPYLPGSDILRAIYYSATDLGDPGEDNVYGNGLMNLDAAFNYLLAQNHLPARPNYGPVNVRAQALVAPESIVCGDSISPRISFINLGDSTIRQATISYRMGNSGPFTSFSWTGQLATDQADTLQLPTMAFPAGSPSITFSFRIMLDSALAEIDTFDNQLSRIIFKRGLVNPPLIEGFEAPNLSQSQLFALNPDGKVGWSVTATSGRPRGSRSAFIDFFNYPDLNARDYLETQRFTAPSSGLFQVRFGVAYAQKNSNSQDGLRISVSTDCGQQWTTVYSKRGDSLATTLPQTTAFTAVNPAHWRQELIDLSAYLGSGDIVLRFEAINDHGNNLYLDDIQLLVSNMKPLVSFNFHLQAGCDTVDVAFQSSIFNADSIRWNFGTTLTDTLPNPSLRLATGSYLVRLIGYNSLGSDTFALTVNIPNAPRADFRLLNSTINAGNNLPLINLSQFASNFVWDFGDGTTATGFAPTKSYNQQGTYTIKLYASNASCTDTFVLADAVTIIQGVSVQELAAAQIKLYPNPAQTAIQVAWGDLEVDQIVLRNTVGQELARFSPTQENNSELLQLGQWPTGIYLLQLQGRNFNVVKRFVKQ